jgi:hypothetical protein
MEHDTELTVRHARARIDGDIARIEVVTDRGRVTLRMHRLVLGALGGAIARALWPKVGEELTEFADTAQDVPIQPVSQEPDREALDAADAPHDVPIDPVTHEPDAEVAGAPAGSEDTPESNEPAEVLAAFEALWPEAEEPASAVAPGDVPTAPASQDPAGEIAPAVTDASHDVPTQPRLEAPEAELASVARAKPQKGSPAPQRRSARRKRRG